MLQKKKDGTRTFIKFSTLTLRVLVLGPILLGGIAVLLIHFSEANRNFRKLEIGMDRAQVEQIMGKPRRVMVEIPGGCKGLWVKPCKEAAARQINSFMSWKAGVDDLYVVGLDENNRVVFLAHADI